MKVENYEYEYRDPMLTKIRSSEFSREEFDAFTVRERLLVERLIKIEERSNLSIALWEPKSPGDSVIGIYMGLQKGVGVSGTDTRIILRDPAERLSAVWANAFLLKQIHAREFLQGQWDLICIKYLGEQKGKTGRLYKAYEFYADLETAWDWLE